MLKNVLYHSYFDLKTQTHEKIKIYGTVGVAFIGVKTGTGNLLVPDPP